ncbi:MAG: YbaB/EbfC family nucleoid-associated protein [Bdellovibrionales bacterium]
MNIAKMMQQAQQMQAKLADMQERLNETEITGQSGGGAVQVTLTGKHEAKKVTIDASVMDDKDMLEDLVVAAINDARTRIEAIMQAEQQQMMGGLQLPPGVKLPF